MKKLIFRCWAKFEGEVWTHLESEGKLVVRPKPHWMPEFLWVKILNKLLYIEAVLDARDGYIDEATIAVEER